MSVAANLSIDESVGAGRRITANTGLLIGSKAIAAALGATTLIVTERALQDPVLFGTVVFIHAYMLFFSQFGTFQSWQSIIRFGADDVEAGDVGGLAKLLKFGIVLDFLGAVFSTILAIAIINLIGWIGSFIPALATRSDGLGPGVLASYTSLYCLLIFLRQRGASIGIFRLFDKFHMLAIKALIMPVLRLLGALTVAWLGGGVEGFLLAWFMGSAVSYLFLPTVAALELHRRRLLIPTLRAKVDLLRPRPGLWAFSIKANVDSSLAAAQLHLPSLLVMAVFGPAFTGIYKVAEEVAKLISEGFSLLDQVIYPELARMVAQGRVGEIWRLVRRAALILLAVGGVMSAIILAGGSTLLGLVFSGDFNVIQAAEIAAILVPAAALIGVVGPFYPVFYAAGKPGQAILARGASVGIYVLVFFGLTALLSVLQGQETVFGLMAPDHDFAPAIAVLIGNIVAALGVVALAKHVLEAEVAKTAPERVAPAPGLQIDGDPDRRIWGLRLREWQRRAWTKAGASGQTAEHGRIEVDANYVLSAPLIKKLVAAPGVALSDPSGHVVARHVVPGRRDTAMSPAALDDGYNKALRKQEDPYALDTRVVPIRHIEDRQFASSYKGITDFVTKFFWPWPAKHVTRWCANLGIRPNQVTTLSLLMVFAAMWFFYRGDWVLGFACGWFMTFLDTVDGKLARTTMTYSKWGNIYDHGIDLVHPPFWYFAWYVGLEETAKPLLKGPDFMFEAMILISVGYVVDRIIEGYFMRRHGFHIHVWTRANSFMRFIVARRNPNMFVFMVGIMAMVVWPPAPIYAFGFIAFWTWFCIAFNVISTIAAEARRGPINSWMDVAA